MKSEIITRKDAILKTLLGIGISFCPATYALILQGCNQSPLHTLGFRIDAEQKKVIAEIASIIIPSSETPGARELKLEEFIIYMIQDCLGPEVKRSFTNGYTDFMDQSLAKYGKGFLDLSLPERIEMVELEDTNAFRFISKVERKLLHSLPTFYQLMKELTVLGYCSSEIGATQALDYVAVPGQYKGCISLDPKQKAWAITI